MKNIELGDIAKDRITGFEGVVVCRAKWLHGCERMTLHPRKLKDGTTLDTRSFDVPQLKLVEKHAVGTTDFTGGPRPEPQAEMSLAESRAEIERQEP